MDTKKKKIKAPAKKAIKKPAHKKGAIKASKADTQATRKELLKAAEIFKIEDKLITNLINGLGRPTKYNPKMCLDIIKHMSEGRTIEDASTLMGISYVTLYNWIKEPTEDNPNPFFQPNFFKAYKLGEQLQRLWWNELGRMNLNNSYFNNTLYMMFRQNLHGWTRRLEGKLEVEKTEHIINEQRTRVDVNMMQGDEVIAEVTRILVESGAIELKSEKITDAQIN